MSLSLFMFSDVLTSQDLKRELSNKKGDNKSYHHKNQLMTFSKGQIAFGILNTNFHLFCPVSAVTLPGIQMFPLSSFTSSSLSAAFAFQGAVFLFFSTLFKYNPKLIKKAWLRKMYFPY